MQNMGVIENGVSRNTQYPLHMDGLHLVDMMINQHVESAPHPDRPAVPSGGFDIGILTTRLPM